MCGFFFMLCTKCSKVLNFEVILFSIKLAFFLLFQNNFYGFSLFFDQFFAEKSLFSFFLLNFPNKLFTLVQIFFDFFSFIFGDKKLTDRRKNAEGWWWRRRGEAVEIYTIHIIYFLWAIILMKKRFKLIKRKEKRKFKIKKN